MICKGMLKLIVNSLLVRLVKLLNLSQYTGVFYSSPSQDNIEFKNFLSDFDDLLCKIVSSNCLFAIILGDFNARSLTWWKEDKTTTEGTHLETLTSLHNFDQLISEPTHKLSNSSSCIDFIFTCQPNLVGNCCTHSTLNTKCHHQITHCQLNLSIKYPPPHEQQCGTTKKQILKVLESLLNQ